jgi:hypothetical protein
LNPRVSPHPTQASKDDAVADAPHEIFAQLEQLETRETLRKEQTTPLLHQEEAKSRA